MLVKGGSGAGEGRERQVEGGGVGGCGWGWKGGGIRQVEVHNPYLQGFRDRILMFCGMLVGLHTKTLKAFRKRYCYLGP